MSSSSGDYTTDNSGGWDEKYRRRELYWGEEPSATVIRLRQYLEAGRVADLGAGEGRNSLYLARSGFDVLAVDNSREGIARIKSRAAAEGIKIETLVDDLTEWKPKELFDGFVCHGVLHFLPRHEGLNLIRRIQVHTRSRGAVSIAAFTSTVPPSKDIEGLVRYLYHPGELESIFQGWEIAVSVEEVVDSDHGEGAHRHAIARLFAVRP